MALETERPEVQLVRCKSPSCDQVLAHQYPDGEIEPKVTNPKWDASGRLYVICPACGLRNRLPVRRHAA